LNSPGRIMRFYFVGVFGLLGVVCISNTAVGQAITPTTIFVDRCVGGSSGWDFSLRSDFTDLGPLGPCTQTKKEFFTAQGATISGANNLLTGQSSAALDGLAALDYRYYASPKNPGDLVGYAVGLFVQGNDTYQFDPTKSQSWNGDIVTTGGFGEISFIDPFESKVTEDFRLRGGEVLSSTGITSDAFVGEWLPAAAIGGGLNVGLPNRLPGTALFYTVTPELMVQYDRLESGPNSYLLFSNRNEALRFGPQVALQLSFEKAYIPYSVPNWVRDFLGSITALITNHESWDTYSSKQYSWTSASLSYSFAENPSQILSHFGITLSYGYGNAEATGNKTNQVKLGLAAKF
jgi:hypothetical protein